MDIRDKVDVQDIANALYGGGWRSTDKDQLMDEHGMSEAEAEAICNKIAEWEVTYYGTDEETFVAHGGKFYLIQSPDFQRADQHEEVASLPEDAEELDPRVCKDIIIPQELVITFHPY